MENKTYDTTIKILWYTIIIVIVLNLIYDFQNFILVGLAALLASATVMKNIENTNKIEKEKKEKENSAFYLEKSISELNNVYDLLKDKNNDRVTWILAARVLKMALELSENITQESHKKFYKLNELQLKHKLLDLFSNAEYRNLSFYVGCQNPLEGDVNSAIIQFVRYKNQAKHLNEKSIYTIFSFIEYPDDFNDPLEDIKIPDNDEEMNKWKRRGGIPHYKKPIENYFLLIINKDGEFDQIIPEK
jgi:hypothetical protein